MVSRCVLVNAVATFLDEATRNVAPDALTFAPVAHPLAGGAKEDAAS